MHILSVPFGLTNVTMLLTQLGGVIALSLRQNVPYGKAHLESSGTI